MTLVSPTIGTPFLVLRTIQGFVADLLTNVTLSRKRGRVPFSLLCALGVIPLELSLSLLVPFWSRPTFTTFRPTFALAFALFATFI